MEAGLAHWLATGGVAGLVALMALERFIPIIPSYVTLVLIGLISARGIWAWPMAAAASCLGSLIGCIIWFRLGRLVPADRVDRWIARRGRFIGLTPALYARAMGLLRKEGGPAMMVAQIIPTVRVFATFPAGVAGLAPWPTLLWSLVGLTVWNSSFILLGYAAGGALGPKGAVPLETAAAVLAVDAILIGMILLLHRGWQRRNGGSRGS